MTTTCVSRIGRFSICQCNCSSAVPCEPTSIPCFPWPVNKLVCQLQALTSTCCSCLSSGCTCSPWERPFFEQPCCRGRYSGWWVSRSPGPFILAGWFDKWGVAADRGGPKHWGAHWHTNTFPGDAPSEAVPRVCEVQQSHAGTHKPAMVGFLQHGEVQPDAVVVWGSGSCCRLGNPCTDYHMMCHWVFEHDTVNIFVLPLFHIKWNTSFLSRISTKTMLKMRNSVTLEDFGY